MKKPFDTELIKTSDGSHTLKLVGHDEQYHSVNGALQESMHVFLNAGLQALTYTHEPLRVLEVGMGTGLNALLAARQAVAEQRVMHYDAIEPYPLDPQWLQQLNYTSILKEEWIQEAFIAIHSAGEDKFVEIREYFFIRCFATTLQQLSLELQRYHLVFFDAFGPDTQPELWSQEIFEKLFQSMKPGAVLVTYCAKGVVRRAMKAAGLVVEKLPGPPGKREMTRAIKP